MKTGAISYRCGHGDHRLIHQSANHTGQGSLHTGHRYDTVGLLDHFQPGQQTMKPTDTHIKNALYLTAKIFRRLSRFLCHGNVRRTRRTDSNLANRLFSIFRKCLQNMGNGIVGNLRNDLTNHFVLMLTGSGAKHTAIRLIKPFGNLYQMLIRLTTAIDHLRKTGTNLSVHIQFGIIHFLKRFSLKVILRLFQRETALFVCFQNFFYFHRCFSYPLYYIINGNYSSRLVRNCLIFCLGCILFCKFRE